MKEFFFTWLCSNTILGGALLTLGCGAAAVIRSPVRRLRLLQWTMIGALGAPVLASISWPWQWSVRWLPAEQVAQYEVRPNSIDTSALPVSMTDRSSGPKSRDNRSEPETTDASSVVMPLDDSRSWADALLGVQALVALLLAGWWCVGAVGLERLWAKATAVRCRKQPEGGDVEVRFHPSVSTPCAFGLRRWRVLVPSAIVGASNDERLEFALAHETSHLRRGDLWTWRLTRFAQFALWYQPAYWWLRRQVRLCQDYLADADAASLGGEVEFASFLLDSARTQHLMVCGAALPLTGKRSDLSRRISMLLEPHPPLERQCPRPMQWATALVVAASLGAAALIRVEAGAQPPPTETATRLYPTAIVTGTLLTPAGLPAAGVKIYGYTYPHGNRARSRGNSFESATDEDGRFSVEIATPGSGAFWFQPDDAAPLGIAAPAERGDLGTVQLKAGIRSHGRVLDAQGGPVAGVQVGVRHRWNSRPPDIDEFNRSSLAESRSARTAITDADGSFELGPLEPGDYAVFIDEAPQSDYSKGYSGVFLIYRANIADDGQELEFRAKPAVSIRVRNIDSDGRMTPAPAIMVGGTYRDEDSTNLFQMIGDRPDDGLCTAVVPKGLRNVKISFMIDPDASIRVRRSPDAKLEAIRQIELNRIDADLDGIEVVRYRAPLLRFRAVDSQGNTVRDIKPLVRYTSGVPEDMAWEPRFRRQENGEWRSISLLPDAEVSVNAMKDGWWSENQNVILEEGEEQEVVVLMERHSVVAGAQASESEQRASRSQENSPEALPALYFEGDPESDADVFFAKGKRVYATYCSPCHRPNGEGFFPHFPPLAGSEWVNAEGPNRLIRLLLDGLQGPITVKGQEFNSVEPPWRDQLKDDEIATVLTYVRGNADWGNTAHAVTPQQVEAVRNLTAGRAKAWSPDELLQIAPAD